MYEVIPGILEKNWAEIERKIELVLPFAKTIHIDILDGEFAPNVTFLNPAPFKRYSNRVFLELHMMVEQPIDYVRLWAEAGFRRFIGHIEEMSDQKAFIEEAKRYGEAGLALDGPTSFEEIKVPLDSLDNIFFYTSDRVGFSGPPLMPERLNRVREVRDNYSTIPIEVDGGINDQTILQARDAGATRFVSTSFIFNAENPQSQFDLLNNLIRE